MPNIIFKLFRKYYQLKYPYLSQGSNINTTRQCIGYVFSYNIFSACYQRLKFQSKYVHNNKNGEKNCNNFSSRDKSDQTRRDETKVPHDRYRSWIRLNISKPETRLTGNLTSSCFSETLRRSSTIFLRHVLINEMNK